MNRTFASIAIFILLSAGCASAPSFSIVTDPAGADIFIDGKQVGKTPAVIKVKFVENSQMVLEKKILVVKLPGYKEKREVISSCEGTATLKFQLMPDHGESAPSVAEVVSKPAVTAVPENQTGVKAEVVSEPSGTTGQVVPSVSKEVVVSQPSATPGL
jgi:hypothetical protein